MTIYDGGIPLNLKLEIPDDGKEKHPLILVIHGFTGDMEEAHLVGMARMMNELGFAVLRADLYGHGTSGGSFRDHTLWKWVSNIMALIDYARGLGQFTEIRLCGHSQGGLAVMLTAAMERDRISGVIALSPAVTIPERARRGTAFGLSFDPDRIPEELEHAEGPLSGNYMRVAQTIRVEEYAEKYDGPILFVHGDADETIPVEASVRISRLYKNAELAVIPDDLHCFDRHLDEAVEAVRKWLLRVC